MRSTTYKLKGDHRDLTFNTILKPKKRILFILRPFKWCTACNGVCKRDYPFWEFADGCGHCGHKEYNHFRGEGEAP